MNLIREHYRLSQQLNRDNHEAYENIVTYLRSSSLTSIEAEEIIGDVLDMLLSAQERSETATEVFGEDLQAFCDELIHSSGKPNQFRKLKENTSILINGFLLLFIIDYLFDQLPSIIQGKQNFLTVHFPLETIFLTLFFTFIATIIVKRIGKGTFKRNSSTLDIVLLLIYSGVLACVFTFTNINNVILFSLPSYVVLPVFLLLGYTSYRLYR